jgi:hypothetical protein
MLKLAAVALIALWGVGGSVNADGKKKPAKPGDGETCTGEHGTTLHFEKTPSDAAKKAQKEEKLVFVLHISGNFEDPDFT